MQIAPIARSAAATPAAVPAPSTPHAPVSSLPPLADDEVRLIAGPHGMITQRGTSAAASALPPSSPNGAVTVKYGIYLMALPGLAMLSYKSSEPTLVHLMFETPDFAELAKNVITHEIMGATFTFSSPEGRPLPPTPGPPYPWNWWDMTANISRAISGFRGVVNVDMGTAGITVWADSQAYLDALKPLFTKRLPDGGYLGWYTWPHPPGGSRPPGTPPPKRPPGTE